MHDLRRRALESNKTQSKKAQRNSAQSSKASSRAGSTTVSRTQSRNASDNESDSGDDMSVFSSGSNDSSAAALLAEQDNHDWKSDLRTLIPELTDRKRSSNTGRESNTTRFTCLLRAHYAYDEVERQSGEIISALGKSIKTEASEKETVLALEALAVLLVTLDGDEEYATVSSRLRTTVESSESKTVKVAAIHTLAIAAACGGGDEDDLLDVISFFQEVAASDGEAVGASDDAVVVTAALQAWGFVTTFASDLEAESEDAIEVFLDQLDSNFLSVQVAAGQNIALLFEKAGKPKTASDDSDSDNDASAADSEYTNHTARNDSVDNDADYAIERNTNRDEANFSSDLHAALKAQNVQRPKFTYQPYHNIHAVSEKVSFLTTYHSRGSSSKGRHKLHDVFRSIEPTIENPQSPPNFLFGHKGSLALGETHSLQIDTWWKLLMIDGIQRALRGGFMTHVKEGNPVADIAPVVGRVRGYGKRSATAKARSQALRAGRGGDDEDDGW